MHKLSEMVYATVFWLISGLLVWLVVLPAALISLPVILLGKAVGQLLFKIPQQNLTEAEISLQNHSEQKSTNAGESLLTSLLMTTLVGVPALLASAVSLQPTRIIKRPEIAPPLSQPTTAQTTSWTETEEKKGET
jgi:lauroyl/myristoyl acyltransferase